MTDANSMSDAKPKSTYTETMFKKIGGDKGDWKCYLCRCSLAAFKITYTGGPAGTGYKLACTDCLNMFRPWFRDGDATS
jgi:hypothetical protein